MTLETVCDEFSIEKSVMRYFADNGIMTRGELNDNELKAVSLIVLLLKSGLGKEKIVQYFQCGDTQCGKNDKERILRTLRETMLDDIHEKQKQLDKIDYVIHDLQTF